MGCANCAAYWLPSARGFQPLSHAVVPATGKAMVYLPFWRVESRDNEPGIHSFHDFLNLTNQTHLLARTGGDRPLGFITPAFKIRPDIYLKIATHLTIGQWQIPKCTDIFPGGHFPINLRPEEAAQSMKLILADSAADKKAILPALNGAEFESGTISLLFLPFADQGYNFYQQDTALSINSRVLGFSRFL